VGTRVRRAIFPALMTSMLALGVVGVDLPHASAQHTPSGPNPVASGEDVRNVSFYYGGTTTLAGADPEQLATTLGRPRSSSPRPRRTRPAP
jgi:hypothetical protein